MESHETLDHGTQAVHHHHSHGAASRHAHGRHLLTVEDLTVAFRMYDEGAVEAGEEKRGEEPGRGRRASRPRKGPRGRGQTRRRPSAWRRYLEAPQREVEVIHSLSLSVHEGEILAVVGASGSGKTLLADAVLGLFEPNALVRGRIWFDGEPMDAASLAAARGSRIALVPQSVASLDPLMRVGRQVEGAPRGRGAARR
ncbi:ATP-binding cassette domain-containing protein, partial [Adlercreutzia muris]|uniref:ATP-binding cassette domain-containing protein n=1 Tax=Adlercreutzia muris TaxID=1796610 RepID=UPI001EEDF42C